MVLNRADSHVGVTHDDVRAIVGRAPDVLVPSHRDIVRSVNEGAPIVRSARRGPRRRRRSARWPTVYPAAPSRAARRRRSPAAAEGGADGAPRAARRPSGSRDDAAPDDPFAEVKNRVHLAVIGELGPQLFNSDVEPVALRERVLADIRVAARARARPRARRPRAAGRRDRRRHRSATARSSGCSPTTRVTEIMVNGPYDIWVERQRPALRDDRAASPTSRTCAASSTRWSRRSGGASTSPRRWSTRACPTAAASTRSSRRCRCRGRWSRSASSRKQRLDLDDLVAPRDAQRRRRSSSSSAASRPSSTSSSPAAPARGKTTLLNALSTAIPDERAHRHDRGRRRAAAQPAPRAAARVAPDEHRGRGRDPDPRARAQLRCACAPTGSSSARSAAPRRWTCCRR